MVRTACFTASIDESWGGLGLWKVIWALEGESPCRRRVSVNWGLFEFKMTQNVLLIPSQATS